MGSQSGHQVDPVRQSAYYKLSQIGGNVKGKRELRETYMAAVFAVVSRQEVLTSSSEGIS